MPIVNEPTFADLNKLSNANALDNSTFTFQTCEVLSGSEIDILLPTMFTAEAFSIYVATSLLPLVIVFKSTIGQSFTKVNLINDVAVLLKLLVEEPSFTTTVTTLVVVSGASEPFLNVIDLIAFS